LRIETVNIYFKGDAPVVFLRGVGDALSAIGMKVAFLPDDVDAWVGSADQEVYSIFQNRVATHARAASLTRLLDTDQWLFNGVDDDSVFDPAQVAEGMADAVFNALVVRTAESFEYPFGMDDFVLVALGPEEPVVDGVRPYTNADMVKQAMDHEPHRQIIVTAVDGLDASALEVYRGRGRISISIAQIDRLLDACAFVVTQDSQVGLRALLHRKHGIQMAACGFHHLLRNPHRDQRIKKSFNRVHRDVPAFEGYIQWLFETRSIDARKKTAPQEVLSKIQELGW
jgi:hypothetical protein